MTLSILNVVSENDGIQSRRATRMKACTELTNLASLLRASHYDLLLRLWPSQPNSNLG
jgi:hypothetical protein